MAKFKVGDEIRILNNVDSQFNKGTIGVIKSNDGSGNREWEVSVNGTSEWFDDHEIELTESKLTKNQRITALENEIAELKVIVHQLRKPSTDVQEALNKADWERGEVEGVIEFEGKQYKKVDREAHEGDVVIFNEFHAKETYDNAITSGKPYKVYFDKRCEKHCFNANDNCGLLVYEESFSRTVETIEVYELIVEDKQPPLLTVAGETRETTHEEIAQLISEPSPNQLRAEIIEKAKVFGESNKDSDGYYAIPDNECPFHLPLYGKAEFVVNVEKRTVVALMKGYASNKNIARGIAKCMPGDVFNEHIGKAIALGRALGLDVSEFEQAVQPTVAVGQRIQSLYKGEDYGDEKFSNSEVTAIDGNGYPEHDRFFHATHYKIINDTNAQYDFVPVGPAPVEELF